MTATARVPDIAGAAPFDAERARKDFPGLSVRIRRYPLIYFDNAATSQRPRQVIEAISSFELTHAANVHRGVHTLSQEATAAYDEARERCGGSSMPLMLRRSSSLRALLLRSTWSLQALAGASKAGRRDPSHRDGAPFKSGALAVDRGADRRGRPGPSRGRAWRA